MTSILVLTKNILIEQNLQKKLQQLNMEVFCSNAIEKMMQTERQCKVFMSYFNVIIVSHTFSNSEAEHIVKALPNYSGAFLRKVENRLIDDEQTVGRKSLFPHWICEEQTSEEIREKVEGITSKRIRFDVDRRFNKKSEDRSFLTKCSFSNNEIKLLNLLLEAPEGFVSKEELCEKLWLSGATISNKCQLSNLITRIKRKLEKNGYSSAMLYTMWGRGYQIDKE